MSPRRLLVSIAFVCIATCPVASAAPAVLGVRWHADKPYPQFSPYWSERGDEVGEDGEVKTLRPVPPGSLGGSVHVYLRNEGSSPLAVEDVLLADISLKQCISPSDSGKKRDPASIYLANLPKDKLERLIAAGEPVWWKVDPAVIAPGATGSVTVRLRTVPRTDAVRLGLKHAGGTLDVSIPVAAPAAAVSGVSFSPQLDTIYAYFRETPGAAAGPSQIRLDGKDVTGKASIVHDSKLGVSAVIIRPGEALERGSYHCIQGIYASKQAASTGLRAWSDEFAYGMWGGMPGEGVEIGRQYLEDLVAHNVNVQMPQVGSGAVAAFFTSEAGKKYIAEHNFRAVMNDAGKWGVNDPLYLFIRDEPDCADYRVTNLPEAKRVGSIAQWCIQRGYELRKAAPQIPQLLNLDMTYKPNNWYNYGQVPDVFCVDPYYQARIRGAYWEHPERIPMYSKATYVYGVATVAQSACEPNPLHTILYSCDWFTADPKRPRFRFATPPEKRIEAFYAIGAGAKGMSYWWYTPAMKAREAKRGVSCGVGAAHKGDKGAQALWREIGAIGAELRTAGPLLVRGVPAELDVKATSGLWTRCLLSGADSVVLLVVNDQYRNDDKGTTVTAIDNTSVSVALPSWLRPADTFEIAADGIRACPASTAGVRTDISLGKVDVTRLIVITADAGLRARLSDLYASKFAKNVAALRAK